MGRDSVLLQARFYAVAACAGLALCARPALAGGDGDLAPTPATQTASPPAPETTPPASTTEDDAERAVKLPNFLGLSGMQEMIDARVPTGLTIRGGLRIEENKTDLHGPLINFSAEQLNLQAYAGVAALELFEVGARLPFEFNRSSKSFTLDGTDRKDASGVGNFDLGGKLSIRFGPLALAPYLIATFPTGNGRFDRTTGGKVGGAATVSILKSIVNLHANVDGDWLEGGHWAIGYRAGVSVVPIATKLLLLRPFVFLNGRQELGDNPGADLRVAAGVQALLFDFVTVEAGGSYRFLSQATPGSLPTDAGTWSIQLGAGVAF